MANLRFEVVAEAFKKRPVKVEVPKVRPSGWSVGLYFCLLLSIFVCANSMQAQTVLYRYNEQGSCTSRIYVDKAQKAKLLQKQSDEAEQVRVAVVPSNIFENQITLSATGVPASCSLSYVMTNASGQIVYQGTFGNEGVSLSTASIPMGIYILKISGDHYEHSYKLIKK